MNKNRIFLKVWDKQVDSRREPYDGWKVLVPFLRTKANQFLWSRFVVKGTYSTLSLSYVVRLVSSVKVHLGLMCTTRGEYPPSD